MFFFFFWHALYVAPQALYRSYRGPCAQVWRDHDGQVGRSAVPFRLVLVRFVSGVYNQGLARVMARSARGVRRCWKSHGTRRGGLGGFQISWVGPGRPGSI